MSFPPSPPASPPPRSMPRSAAPWPSVTAPANAPCSGSPRCSGAGSIANWVMPASTSTRRRRSASARTAPGSSSGWPMTSTACPHCAKRSPTGELGWTKAQQVARVASAETQAQWVAQAKTAGRRELEREVQAARGVARRQARSAAGAGKQLEMSAALAPAQVVGGQVVGGSVARVEPCDDHTGVPCTITLRGDALQVARFEVLLEKVRKVRAVPAGSERLEVVLAGLEALVAGASVVDDASTVRERRDFAPAYQIVVQQCPTAPPPTWRQARGTADLRRRKWRPSPAMRACASRESPIARRSRPRCVRKCFRATGTAAPRPWVWFAALSGSAPRRGAAGRGL
jgi:hypothetical protein